MTDEDCVRFLQWALPRLQLRWPGFRRVRRQVCRRIQRRIGELGLVDVARYREYLAENEAEWKVLETCCRVTISSFYRDRRVFEHLGADVLPALAQRTLDRGSSTLRCWSAGCASGEEPYTLALVWGLQVGPRFPNVRAWILGTDLDDAVLERARSAIYPASSVKDLPTGWLERSFLAVGDGYRLADEFRSVEFRAQDLRREMPEQRFQLILCRNLAFTYFDQALQAQVLARLHERLDPGGVLVVGRRESIPTDSSGFIPLAAHLGLFQRE